MKGWEGVEGGEVGLGLQIEGELPLLRKRGAAHLHREPPCARPSAVQAKVTAHVSKLGVALDLLPFLHKTHTQGNIFG